MRTKGGKKRLKAGESLETGGEGGIERVKPVSDTAHQQTPRSGARSREVHDSQ